MPETGKEKLSKKKRRNLFVFPKYAILLKIVFLWNRKDSLFLTGYFKMDFNIFRSYYLGLLYYIGKDHFLKKYNGHQTESI